MSELCPSLRVRARKQQDFALQFESCPVWHGSSWGTCGQHDSGAVAQISWGGINLLSIGDDQSNLIAKNRACAMVSTILKKDPNLLSRLNEMTSMLQSKDFE
mmetsp:Transcript_6076/g.12741  ORF Transcript_6076/g.12741 Transcript_6076/m.12741 type:complete len:102 (-) Transcript_6076:37-342(-)